MFSAQRNNFLAHNRFAPFKIIRAHRAVLITGVNLVIAVIIQTVVALEISNNNRIRTSSLNMFSRNFKYLVNHAENGIATPSFSLGVKDCGRLVGSQPINRFAINNPPKLKDVSPLVVEISAKKVFRGVRIVRSYLNGSRHLHCKNSS